MSIVSEIAFGTSLPEPQTLALRFRPHFKQGVSALLLVAAGLASGCATLTAGVEKLADSMTPEDTSPDRESTALLVDQVIKPGYIVAPEKGQDPYKMVGKFPMLDISNVSDETSSTQINPGRHVIDFNCFMPYETTFRKSRVELIAEPGRRYELTSTNTACTEYAAEVFTRMPEDKRFGRVPRAPERVLLASMTRSLLIEADEFQGKDAQIATQRDQAQRAELEAQKRQFAINAVETLKAGVGSKVCSWPDRYATEGFIERVENGKIKVLVTRHLIGPQTQQYVWDDPANWILCK